MGTVRIHAFTWSGHPHTVLVMAYQPVSPFDRNGALNTGFSRQHRAQGLSPFPWTGSEEESVVSGLPTSECATFRRRPLSPRVTVQTRLLKSNTSSREQAHKTNDLARRRRSDCMRVFGRSRSVFSHWVV